MSRMQETSGTVETNYAHLADSITAEANNQERRLSVPEVSCYEERNSRRERRGSVVRIVQPPTSRDELNGATTKKGPKYPIMPQTRASRRQGHSHARSRSLCRKGFCRLPLVQNENDYVDGQIRTFKDREDLRECRIPGMVSGISQKACEGWRRQTTAHSARFMAKIKLSPCKDCKYSSESCGSSRRRNN
jgi:hypothetical protein